MAKRKRLLPSPDISQHEIAMLLGMALNAAGYLCLSGGSKLVPRLMIMDSSNGIHLLIGLVLISCGSAAVIASVMDSFLNGLSLSVNQTEIAFVAINISVLIGPLFGGLGLDLVDNAAPALFEIIGLSMAGHLALYLLAMTTKYLWRGCVRLGCAKVAESTAEQERVKSVNAPKAMPQCLESTECVEMDRNNELLSDPQSVKEVGLSVLDTASVKESGLKQRVKAKKRRERKRSNNMGRRVYIYGTDLRHLCWWKRGLNVRFPYIQWLESGWSSTQQPIDFMNRSKR